MPLDAARGVVDERRAIDRHTMPQKLRYFRGWQNRRVVGVRGKARETAAEGSLASCRAPSAAEPSAALKRLVIEHAAAREAVRAELAQAKSSLIIHSLEIEELKAEIARLRRQA